MKHIIIAAIAAAAAATAVPAFAEPGHDFRAHPEWTHGKRIGHDDWGRGQPVDWHAHHLRKPARGYEWREVDGNYVLAAAATGLIASVIANGH